MDVGIKLNKNFVAALNRLEQKYGEKIMKINGFSNDNLNFSSFIDRFTKDNDQLVDLSVNPSANMAQKDVVTMINSMSEPHMKLLAFNKIYYELTKKYGRDVANEALENLVNGELYMHDATTASFFP